MDDDQDEGVLENCIILPPEELARLGVKIDTLAAALGDPSNPDHAKKKGPEESDSIVNNDSLKPKNRGKPKKASLTSPVHVPKQKKVSKSKPRGSLGENILSNGSKPLSSENFSHNTIIEEISPRITKVYESNDEVERSSTAPENIHIRSIKEQYRDDDRKVCASKVTESNSSIKTDQARLEEKHSEYIYTNEPSNNPKSEQNFLGVDENQPEFATAQTHEDFIEGSCTTDTPTIGSPVKKRGRPRKQPASKEISVIRKRGRPRKERTIVYSSDSEGEVQNCGKIAKKRKNFDSSYGKNSEFYERNMIGDKNSMRTAETIGLNLCEQDSVKVNGQHDLNSSAETAKTSIVPRLPSLDLSEHKDSLGCKQIEPEIQSTSIDSLCQKFIFDRSGPVTPAMDVPVKKRGSKSEKNPNSSTPQEQSAKKKSGRPRKERAMIDSVEEHTNRNISAGPSNEESDFNKSKTIFEQELGSHFMVPSLDDSLIVPKKRGRPRKSAVEPPSSVDVTSEANVAIVTSQRGRKRKEVNYSLVEEGDMPNDNINRTKNSGIEEDKSELFDNGKLDKTREDHSHENSKYKWTGHTTTAMNQLFSTLQGKDVSEVRHDSQSGLVKRKRGWNSKKTDCLDDKDGSSVCAMCNETVANLEWPKHKRKIHYNLTWRKGDPPVDISDTSVVEKVLAQLRHDKGYLKCRKCKTKKNQVKKFIEHLETCNGVVSGSGFVTCAVCKKEMAKSEWQYHKYREHNNLAWRKGDPPLDLQDQDLVVRILTQLYKSRKPLHCEKCKKQVKSVLGYLSHKSVCQLSEEDVEKAKVSCNLCGKKMLPVSMDYHMKIHKKPSKYDLLEESTYFDVSERVTPRKAAQKARQVIESIKDECVDQPKYCAVQCDFKEQFVMHQLKRRAAECPDLSCIFNDCQFQTTYIDTMVQHLNSCDKKPEQYFICKLCLACCQQEQDIVDHLKTTHNRALDGDKTVEFIDESDQENSENDQVIDRIEAEKKRLMQKSKYMLSKNDISKVKPIFLTHPIGESNSSLLYAQAYPWMLNFCEVHFTNFHLFESFRNSDFLEVLDCDILNEYLPKHHASCDIAVKQLTVNENFGDRENINFRNMELFEACNFYKGEATFYCGGPVSSLAWLPTPYNHEDRKQVLAVAVLNGADEEYSLGQIYNESCVIQFWDFGELHHRQETNFKPSLLFGLALASGPVWHLEWCPSGCFDLSEVENRSRLGLLAVATSDSFAYIYCINDIKEENDRGLIYKGEPLVKLQLQNKKDPTEQCYYATRISWTKAEGHRYMAVGYSTGMVAIFDLMSTSVLFQKKDHSGMQIILPYQTFQAHVSCVTGLTLGHYGGGNRWCFTGGLDKAIIFWDLYNMVKVTYHRKYGFTDGTWLTQWPACLLAEDETTFNDLNLAHTFIKPVRDVMCPEPCNYTISPSGLKSVSFGDWLNLILHGGNSGEIMGQFAHRMFFNVDKKRFKKGYTKCIFSVAKLISKNNCIDKPSHADTYQVASSQYGILFMDYNSDTLTQIPNSKTNDVKKIEVPRYNIHDYPLQAVNKVALNPNPQACTFYACGYQAGFVRVRHMRFLKGQFGTSTFSGYNFSGSV